MFQMRHSTPEIISVNSNVYNKGKNRQISICEPIFGEFQLMGDSILVRFANQILYNHRKFPFGARTIGYCINSQRIDQLRQRVKLKSFPLSSKVMVLIGTNDVLGGGNIHTMTKHFNSLLTLLKQSTDKILILTLPPIPKLCVTYYHWTLIRQYNAFLKSLDDGVRIVVADICPLFTKFTPALLYEINVVGYPRTDDDYCGKRRKSWPKHRRTRNLENRKSLPNNLRSDESDYRNSTDTNTSIHSEVPSSEDRENFHSTSEKQAVKSGQKRSSENVGNQGRFILRTLESVFGKEVLSRRKTEEPSTASSSFPGNQPEKKPRKIPMDLNENLCATDDWLIESEDDSTSEHVYKSQEETDYVVMDMGCERGSEMNREFSKFVESLNESPKRIFRQRRSGRNGARNEMADDSESSSSSDCETPKRQVYPFIDPDFRKFFENSTFEMDESFVFDSSSNSKVSPEFDSCGWFHRSRRLKKMEGLSGREKLLMHLSSKICHLELYELFYSSGKKRIDMIHLNYKGLTEVKKYLLYNNYVTV